MRLIKKEVTRIRDRLEMKGAVLAPFKRGGLLSKDGKPVDPALIAKAFQVSLDEAKEISRRMSL